MAVKALRSVLLLLLLSFFCYTSSWAVEIRGRSSTQFLWYNDFYNGRQIDFAQYLRIAATNIDQAGKFSLYGYGRAGVVLQNADDNDKGANGRLYYLYGDYRNVGNKVDVRVGRQFTNLSAESALIDGVRFDVKNAGPLGFTLLGGRNVVFGLNGELTHPGDYAFGMSAYLQGLRNTDLDVSWFRKWDQYDVARDMLGASFKQYLLNNLKLYGNARYDVVGEVFSELLGGIKYFPLASLTLTGEFYQSYPTFDTTSIFSVFAVNQYKEALVRADYTISEKLGVYGGYKRQDFGDDSGQSDVYTVGLTLRPLEILTIDIDYDHTNGYGGDLNGGTVDVSLDATKELRLSGGMAYDVYQRSFFADGMTDTQTSKNYWIGAKYKLNKQMTASLRLDDNVNVTSDNDWQGRFIFDYDF